MMIRISIAVLLVGLLGRPCLRLARFEDVIDGPQKVPAHDDVLEDENDHHCEQRKGGHQVDILPVVSRADISKLMGVVTLSVLKTTVCRWRSGIRTRRSETR